MTRTARLILAIAVALAILANMARESQAVLGPQCPPYSLEPFAVICEPG